MMCNHLMVKLNPKLGRGCIPFQKQVQFSSSLVVQLQGFKKSATTKLVF
jgi:hypothetical protein